MSNAEFAQKLVNDYPAGGKHAKKRRLLAQAMEVVTCGNLAHDAVHGNRVDGVGGGDPPMAVALRYAVMMPVKVFWRPRRC